MRAALLVFALAACAAWAVDDTSWPPPGKVEDRMHELQAMLRDPRSSLEQREAAREELANLLKSPAGQSRPTPDEKPLVAPRAAIQPFPSVVKPAPPISESVPATPGIAHLEVLAPPIAPLVNPRQVAPPAPAQNPGQERSGASFAIDPLTGHVLHPVPGGYIDPRNGQRFPR